MVARVNEKMDLAVTTNYNTTYQTPFKLPLWSEWTVQVKGQSSASSACPECSRVTASLKELAINSLFSYLKRRKTFQNLPLILVASRIPPVLHVDVARQLFVAKQWVVLRCLISHWPFERLQLSQIVQISCQACWSSYLESEDVDNPESEGGDTERQLLRKVFKHVLDSFFFVVKSTLENDSSRSPLRVLDLTLDPSQPVRGFMWEEEFRRLARRVMKLLDVCILAGFHKKARQKFVQDARLAQPTSSCAVATSDVQMAVFEESNIANTANSPTMPSSLAGGRELPNFEISTWSDVNGDSTSTFNSTSLSKYHCVEKASPQRVVRSGTGNGNSNGSAHCASMSMSPEIGVWNGNAIDLSHLTEIPVFSVIVDASISEKSADILSWMQQRYDEFLPAPSPVTTRVRFLEVSLHEERKFDSLAACLPDNIKGLELAEICERRTATTLATSLPTFRALRFLDLGSCAFDLTDNCIALDRMAEAFRSLPRLERLSLAHNCLTDCLSTILAGN